MYSIIDPLSVSAELISANVAAVFVHTVMSSGSSAHHSASWEMCFFLFIFTGSD